MIFSYTYIILSQKSTVHVGKYTSHIGILLVTHPVENMRRLVEDVFECRSSARQRCGRAGRVAPGLDG